MRDNVVQFAGDPTTLIGERLIGAGSCPPHSLLSNCQLFVDCMRPAPHEPTDRPGATRHHKIADGLGRIPLIRLESHRGQHHHPEYRDSP